MDKIRVLYVDDELDNLKSFKATFRRDFDITICQSPIEAIDVIKENEFEVIFSDQKMPEMKGTELLSLLIKSSPDSIRILLTGYSDIEAVIDAINKGQVYRYITKPWNEEEIKSIIKNAFELYSLRKENKLLTKNLLQVNEQLEFMLRQKLIS